jgi:hypothetical protein
LFVTHYTTPSRIKLALNLRMACIDTGQVYMGQLTKWGSNRTLTGCKLKPAELSGNDSVRNGPFA